MQTDIRSNIQGLMDEGLGDWLAEQNTMREEARKKAHNRWFYCGIAALPVLAVLWFAIPIGFQIKGFISFGIAMAAYAWGNSPIQAAKRAIKEGINSAIARQHGISYSHDVEPGGEFEACCAYGLLPGYQRDSFEDHWYGSLEGHDFSLYEAHLEERRGSGKNRRWVTVFRGAILRMQFGRKFHSTTLLQRKGKNRKWFGLGGQKDEVTFNGHRLALVDQVHPDFEDVFEVYSDDQVEARVIIHPAYIEHLLALEQAFHGDAVRALFSNGEVAIVVESGDLFESGGMNADQDAYKVAEAARQFGAMRQLALSINQNDRGRVMGGGNAPPSS